MAEAEAGHEASDDELAQGEGGGLQQGPEGVDGGAEQHGLLAAELVAEPDAVQGAEEAAERLRERNLI